MLTLYIIENSIIQIEKGKITAKIANSLNTRCYLVRMRNLVNARIYKFAYLHYNFMFPAITHVSRLIISFIKISYFTQFYYISLFMFEC